MVKNNGGGLPYYTQRNNRESPGAACNVTAMVAALSAAGYDVDSLVDAGVQPEDDLMRFIRRCPEVIECWKKIDPAGKTPPNEWHKLLALGTNRWLESKGVKRDREIVSWSAGVSLASLKECLDEGGAAVMSGLFHDAEAGRKINHVIAIIGYKSEDGKDVDGFFIDDSWGDYTTGYRNKRGKSVFMPFEDWKRLCKPSGCMGKWGHLVRRSA